MVSRLKYPSGFCSYVIWFLAILLVCSGLLCLSMFLPQNRIHNHLKESTEQFLREGDYAFIYDVRPYPSNQLDNATDSTMLLESFYAFNWENLWKNAVYFDENTSAESFHTVIHQNTPPNSTYSRYWAGFRGMLRLLLVFFNYLEIRHVISLIFFSLFILAVITLYRYSNTASALAFGLSIALVKPEIISNSLQFSCCFLIAFAAMILVVKARKMGYPQFFLCVGCLTQFLDFYTTPVITWAFPLLLLLAFESYSTQEKWVMTAKTCAAWLSGWLAMWLAKLTLTCLFTDEDAFGLALSSVKTRIGVEKYAGLEYTYSPARAIFSCILTLFHRNKNFFLFIILLCAALVLIALWNNLKRNPSVLFPEFILDRMVFVVIGLVPFLWFSITASPTVIHCFFQYRTIAVSVCAFLLCLTLPIKQKISVV